MRRKYLRTWRHVKEALNRFDDQDLDKEVLLYDEELNDKCGPTSGKNFNITFEKVNYCPILNIVELSRK